MKKGKIENGVTIVESAACWIVKAGSAIVHFCSSEEEAQSLKKAIDGCYRNRSGK